MGNLPKTTQRIKLQRAKAKRAVLRHLKACAEYILMGQDEWDDFETFVSEGNDPFQHVLSHAIIAVHGMPYFEAHVSGLKTNQNETKGE